MNGKVVISFMLGVKDHDKVTINNPGETTTKGSRYFSRFKTRVEVTGVELSKRRVFSVCGEKGGHNSRICTQLLHASKKSKKQDMPKRVYEI